MNLGMGSPFNRISTMAQAVHNRDLPGDKFSVDAGCLYTTYGEQIRNRGSSDDSGRIRRYRKYARTYAECQKEDSGSGGYSLAIPTYAQAIQRGMIATYAQALDNFPR